MAGRKLAVNTTVDGQTYEAGSTPDAEVAKLITNPKAWGNSPEPEKAPAKRSASSKSEK